jgi:hypothetical protein
MAVSEQRVIGRYLDRLGVGIFRLFVLSGRSVKFGQIGVRSRQAAVERDGATKRSFRLIRFTLTHQEETEGILRFGHILIGLHIGAQIPKCRIETAALVAEQVVRRRIAQSRHRGYTDGAHLVGKQLADRLQPKFRRQAAGSLRRA